MTPTDPQETGRPMDAVAEAIRRGVHGEPTDADPTTIQCVLYGPHGEGQPVETDHPVQGGAALTDEFALALDAVMAMGGADREDAVDTL